MDAPLFTLPEAAREIGRPTKVALIRRLIVIHSIPSRKIGQSIVLDREAIRLLGKVVADHESRPRPFATRPKDAQPA